MITGIHHFALTVSDMDRSLAFYTDLFGLEVLSDREVQGDYVEKITGIPGAHSRLVHLAGYGQRLELLQYKNPRGEVRARPLQDAGSAHVCFITDDLDAEVARLQAANVTFRSLPGRHDQRAEQGRSRYLRRGSGRERRGSRAVGAGGDGVTGRLDGKVVLVSGAGGGLGLACCRLFADEGARVVLSDLDPGTLERALAEGGGHLAIGADVTNEADTARLVSRTVEELGSLDALVAAAGLHQTTPVDAIEMDEWDRVQTVNVRGTFTIARAALREMIPRRQGSVVMLGSIAGQLGGVQSGAGYATSKAAVIGMTKALARYAGPSGVRVNCVNPGFIESGMGLEKSPDERERTIAATPLGRAGTAEEVAEAVLWLASDASSFVTGAQLDVNGGLLMA